MPVLQRILQKASTTLALLLASLLLVIISQTQPVSAAQTIPYKINFQGRLTDNNGNIVADGLYNIKFTIYNASSGGTNLWQEYRQTTNRVQITNGLFDVRFGDVTALSPSLFNSSTQLYLEVELPTPATATCTTSNCASFTEGPLSPRQPIAATPYAFNSDTIDGIDGASLARVDQANTFTGNQTINGTLSATTLQQGANAVCDNSNNCNYTTATQFGNALLQGGNTYGTAVTLGSNDSQSLVLETANSPRITILSTGQIGVGVATPTRAFELAASTVATGGIGFGTDVDLYRSAADTLAIGTGDSLNLVSGNIQIAGTTIVTSARVLQNVTANTSILTAGTLAVQRGGTGAATHTAGGILFGNGTSAFTNSGVLANGQLLIGDGSGAPTVGTLTAGTGISVANGAGSITVATSSDVALKSATSNFTGTLQQSGNDVCHAGNNCSALYAAATGGTGYIQNGTSPQTANFNVTGDGTIGGNVGIGVTASSTAKLNVNGDIRSTYSTTRGLQRTVPIAINDAVDIGTINTGVGAAGFYITVSVNDSGFSVSKIYNVPTAWNQGSNTWQLLQPISDSGPYAPGTNDVALDIKISNSIISLRLRRTVGATAGTAQILLRQEGGSADIFTPSTTLTSVIAPTTTFSSTSLTQTNGRVGIGTGAPSEALHVVGNGFFTGMLTATSFQGSGASLTSLNASSLASGTVDTARIAGSYTGVTGVGALTAGSIGGSFGNINIGSNTFTGSGSGLTNLNASSLSTGTVTDGLLSSNVPLKDGTNTFTGTNTFNNQALFNAADTAGSPGVAWSGDTNTGFFHPAADTISASTNSAERLRVHAGGNISIGATPSSNLGQLSIVNDTAADVALLVRGAASQSGNFFSIQNNDGSSTFLSVNSGGTLTVQPLTGSYPIIIRNSAGTTLFSIDPADQLTLGSGGSAFTSLKKAVVSVDFPNTLSGSTSSINYDLPAGTAVISVQMPATTAGTCSGGFGCITKHSFDKSSNVAVTRVVMQYQNASSVDSNPNPSNWTIWYIEP